MVRIFVHSSESLRIYHYYIHFFIGWALNGFFPKPESLGAGVNGGSYLESRFFLVEEYSVNEEALASSIFSNDRNNSEFAIFGEGGKKLFCFLA